MARCTPRPGGKAWSTEPAPTLQPHALERGGRTPGHRDDTQGPTAVNTRPVRLPSWTARAPGKHGQRQHSGPMLPQPRRMWLGSHRPLRAQNISGLLHKQEATLPHLHTRRPSRQDDLHPRTPARLRPQVQETCACKPRGSPPGGGGGGRGSPSQPHCCPYRECLRPAMSTLRSTVTAPHPGAPAGARDALRGPG